MKEASYTVEAVFVGCITIWVILALLYSSFYIHDRMILGSEIGNRIECGSERGELSVSEKEENNLCRLLNEKLFLMKINQVSLTKKIASVRADVRYSLPISLSEIKALFVTRETGQNFVKYLTDYRLREACRLLRTTTLGVSEIAARLGFGDALYFSRRFRQKTGSSPSQYRKALVLHL